MFSLLSAVLLVLIEGFYDEALFGVLVFIIVVDVMNII